MLRHRREIPADDWTVGELKEWLKAWIESAREERGEAFDIEGALRLTKNRLYTWVYSRIQADYRTELQKKYIRDSSRCRYCGNSLELYPGLGHYCDICADKFMDHEPHETEEEYDD